MKNNRIVLSMIFCLLFLTVNCSAQGKSITKKEYESVQRVAEENFNKIPYTSSTKIEEYSNDKLSKTAIIDVESIPPKMLKWTEVTTSGNKTTKIEIVTVDNVEYRRENGGAWVKRDFSKSNEDGGASGLSFSGQESPNKKKYTVEQTNLNNQAVRIYSVSTVYDFEPNIVLSYRRWINSDNQILKSEEIYSEIKSGKITRHEVVSYEYNPKNIKIEVPIK